MCNIVRIIFVKCVQHCKVHYCRVCAILCSLSLQKGCKIVKFIIAERLQYFAEYFCSARFLLLNLLAEGWIINYLTELKVELVPREGKYPWGRQGRAKRKKKNLRNMSPWPPPHPTFLVTECKTYFDKTCLLPIYSWPCQKFWVNSRILYLLAPKRSGGGSELRETWPLSSALQNGDSNQIWNQYVYCVCTMILTNSVFLTEVYKWSGIEY